MWRDLRDVARQLKRAPGLVAAATLTLALGIGANTAVFSVLNGFQRPLPVPSPENVVILAAVLPGDDTGLRYRFSFPALQDYRQKTDIFSDVFAFDLRIGGLGTGGRTTQFVYQSVTGNFFSGLGLKAAIGRLFEPGEGEHPNAEIEIVLGHSHWVQRFGGDPSVLGRVVRLDGRAARIVGVAPEGFRGLFEGADMDGYLTIGSGLGRQSDAAELFTNRSVRLLTMAARLRQGVTLDVAQSAAGIVAAQLAAAYPATEHGTTVRVVPERFARPVPLPSLGRLMPLIWWLLFGLASLVLFIACMNVANLLLVRATVREREMVVRAALGASRRRLVRLLLVESLALAILGTVLGLIVGKAMSSAFQNSIYVGTDVPLRLDFDFDWRVFTYAVSMTLVTGIVVGLLPALRASRARLTGVLHDGGRAGSAGGGRQRLRSLLVVSQVAGSLALLVVAGLFVRSLQGAHQVDVGFDPDEILTVRLDPQHVGYDASRTGVFYDELERRIRAMPGVDSVSMSFSIPLGYIFGALVVRIEGEPPSTEPRPAIGDNSVTPAYFDTLRIPIVRGRAFTDQDIQGSKRVIVVNETFARRFWPDQDPLGKRVELPLVTGPLWTVVGVARDSKYFAAFEPPLPHFYLPQKQHPTFLRTVAIRSKVPPAELGARINREIATLDADMPIADLRPLRDTLEGNIAFVLFRIGRLQATAMSVLGLVLAVIGVYGVVSYRTAQRRREIGIRMALGASPADVRRLVLGQGAALVVTGVVIGLVATLVVARVWASVLVFVSAADPTSFGVATLLISSSAALACYLPARRAMRGEPIAALRHE